jgi:hypothetical protein
MEESIQQQREKVLVVAITSNRGCVVHLIQKVKSKSRSGFMQENK